MPSEGFGHRDDATGEAGGPRGCANASRGRKHHVGMKRLLEKRGKCAGFAKRGCEKWHQALPPESLEVPAIRDAAPLKWGGGGEAANEEPAEN